jgi:NAD(P)-dependent dehydrogenase (short-subunit alcohol dehydrogenase family)
MPDRIRLDGKVAVVTGAAGVIGTATIRLLAERGARATTGVRVNCVCPGLIDSRMRARSLRDAIPPTLPSRTRKSSIGSARRLGQASEVASLVAFLASDDASYVSAFDGGRVAS